MPKLTKKKMAMAGRVDQVVRDYFASHPNETNVRALELMDEFVKKEIFAKDYTRPGLPIRNLLRDLDKENQLSLLKHVRVVRNPKNRSWYFER